MVATNKNVVIFGGCSKDGTILKDAYTIDDEKMEVSLLNEDTGVSIKTFNMATYYDVEKERLITESKANGKMYYMKLGESKWQFFTKIIFDQ